MYGFSQLPVNGGASRVARGLTSYDDHGVSHVEEFTKVCSHG